MSEDYFRYYLLSYFDREKETSISQVFHVFRGKRTPSMFYITEINQWHHGFSFYPTIEKNKIKETVGQLLKNKLIIQTNGNYLQTKIGQEKLKEYFKYHYFPHKLTSFTHLNMLIPFWERFQLFTQVFSEYSYQNNHYLPVIKKPEHQENIRQLFQVAGKNIDNVLEQWLKEQYKLFEILEQRKANIIVSLLTGYNQIGKTRIQIRKELNMQRDEFNFYLRSILEELIQLIKKNKQLFPFLYHLMTQVHQEVSLGLSKSTYQSYQLVKKNIGIQQIARQRRLKESTIKEHILEMAFVLDEFPIKHFVPHDIYMELSKEIELDKKLNFKRATGLIGGLEFYQYRLVELERIRLL